MESWTLHKRSSLDKFKPAELHKQTDHLTRPHSTLPERCVAKLQKHDISVYASSSLVDAGYISRGRYTSVLKVYIASDLGLTYAMKKSNNCQQTEDVKELMKTCRLWASTSHSNIIRIFGVCPEIGGVLMDEMSLDLSFIGLSRVVNNMGQLLTLLHSKNLVQKFDDITKGIHQIASDIICGIAALHDKNIPHGNLKPSNVLVSGFTDKEHPARSIICKISDFEACEKLYESYDDGEHSSLECYDAGWPFQSPEEIFDTVDSRKLLSMDIWSIGALLFVLLNPDQCHPFEIEYKTALKESPLANLKDTIAFCKQTKQGPTFSPTFRAIQKQNSIIKHIVGTCMTFEARDRPAAISIFRLLRVHVTDVYADIKHVNTDTTDIFRAVSFENVPMKEDLFELYFRKVERSGSTSYEDVFCDVELQKLVVIFPDHKTAENVIGKNPHELMGFKMDGKPFVGTYGASITCGIYTSEIKIHNIDSKHDTMLNLYLEKQTACRIKHLNEFFIGKLRAVDVEFEYHIDFDHLMRQAAIIPLKGKFLEITNNSEPRKRSVNTNQY